MKLSSLLVCLFLPALAGAQSRADPDSWILWRAAPIPFPDTITPRVPELMQGPPAIDFRNDGSDLTIILPDGLGDDYDSKALRFTQRFIVDKARKVAVVTASQVSAAQLRHHLLLLGTPQTNAFVARVLGDQAGAFLEGIRPGGYRIQAVENPEAKDKRAILALGSDPRGAYAAGLVLCHAIHPNKEGVNALANWPAKIPAGCYWLPFEAKASPPEQEFDVTGLPNPPPPKPRVPFGHYCPK